MNANFRWDDVIKKEASGVDGYDLGEVQEVEADTVVTKKGVFDKDRFYLPNSLVEAFDGDFLRFRITKEEAQNYRRD
ncbi:MAG TPA: hypothetical protein VF884_00030 [Nitrososphaeraceae archaeon]